MTQALVVAFVLVAEGAPTAAPDVVVGVDVDPGSRAIVEATWSRLAAVFLDTTGHPPRERLDRIEVRRAFSLDASEAAAARPGLIEVRSGPKDATALAHETAHQLLFSACPQASRDALFHEAFAVAVSGEIEAWADDAYVTLPQAVETLGRGALSSKAARRALARVLREGGARDGALPHGLRAPLQRCADDAPWTALTVADLVGLEAVGDVDVLVVLHRSSGEVLEARGEAERALPFGSTLKPFLIAGASGELPRLRKRLTEATWACGPTVPDRVDANTALLASCNGWFLDWGASNKAAHTFGAWGPVLRQLGLTGAPADMSEAIGVRTSLRISARGVAEAYRALAASSHDVVSLLEKRGTLLGADGVERLDGASAKTGTVRDERSRPVVGWLVAVDERVVVVRVRSGVPARALVNDVADAVKRHATPPDGVASVQTFGLLDERDAMLRCDGVGMRVGKVPALVGPLALAEATSHGDVAVCAKGPWTVSFSHQSRAYAGLFRRSDTPRREETGPATERQKRARRGSAFVFETRTLPYVRGVLDAEDAAIRGEARVALARVIAHDATHADERHPGRPPCDTTHCMTFLGTRGREDAVDVAALSGAHALGDGWLMFSQGGSAPWRETRSAAEVRAKLGTFSTIVARDGGAVVVRATDAGGDHDEAELVSCEMLRTRLLLPGCPAHIVASSSGTSFTLDGTGAGHGLGLDVERAKAMAADGRSADEILRDAFGRKGDSAPGGR